jgi:hypothetical protein
MVRLFFGSDFNQADDIGFSFVSDELDGRSHDADGTRRTQHLRKYTRLIDAMYENAVSRVYLGVHWRFDGTTATDAAGLLAQSDNIGGVPLGRTISNDIYTTLEADKGADQPADFSVFMLNRLYFSNPDTPTIPNQDKGIERLKVTRKGDLLTIAEAPENAPIGNTIYAQKSGAGRGTTKFKILSKLPGGITDPNFFKAEGRAAVSRLGGRWRLYAYGTDDNGPQPNGWVFDATEE